MRVTDTACGLFVTPVAVLATKTVAVYVPATRLAGLADSVNVAGAVVPESAPTPSQPVGCPAAYVGALTDKLVRVSAPPFVTVTVCARGAGAPAKPAKVRAVAESAIRGTLWTVTATVSA